MVGKISISIQLGLLLIIALILLNVTNSAGASGFNLQGTVIITNNINGAYGGSAIYDNYDLHIATDDYLYLDAPKEVKVKSDLNVNKLLKINNSVVGSYSGTSIYDNYDLHIATDDYLYLDAPKMIYANGDLTVKKNLIVDGTISGALTANSVSTAQLTNNAVTGAQVASNAINNSHISNNAGIAQSKVVGLTDLQANFNTLKTDMDSIKIKVDSLVTSVASINGSIMTINNEIASLKSRVSALESIKYPLVADSNNRVIGALFDISYPGSPTNYYGVFDPVSKAIYHIDPVTGQAAETGSSVTFTEINCTGQAYAMSTRVNYAFSGGTPDRFFTSNSYTEVNYISKSLYQSGVCVQENNGNGTLRQGYIANEVTPSFGFPVVGPLKLTTL